MDSLTPEVHVREPEVVHVHNQARGRSGGPTAFDFLCGGLLVFAGFHLAAIISSLVLAIPVVCLSCYVLYRLCKVLDPAEYTSPSKGLSGMHEIRPSRKLNTIYRRNPGETRKVVAPNSQGNKLSFRGKTGKGVVPDKHTEDSAIETRVSRKPRFNVGKVVERPEVEGVSPDHVSIDDVVVWGLDDVPLQEGVVIKIEDCSATIKLPSNDTNDTLVQVDINELMRKSDWEKCMPFLG